MLHYITIKKNTGIIIRIILSRNINKIVRLELVKIPLGLLFKTSVS